MGTVTKRILFLLVICFFMATSIHGIFVNRTPFKRYPKLARCESDADCLQGKAKCIRRECQCQAKHDVGDGKTECKHWSACVMFPHSCDGHSGSSCLRIANKDKGFFTCKCKDGNFGSPSRDAGEFKHCRSTKPDKDGRGPCITDQNCHDNAFCNKKDFKCYCKDGYEGNGDNCIALPADCTSDEDCHADKGSCIDGKCNCKGKTVARGKECRDLKPCGDEDKKLCGGSKVCLIDPDKFPKQCAALDECEKQGDFCPQHSTCTKKQDGSHACICKVNYKMEGTGETRACIEMDECEKKGDYCLTEFSGLVCLKKEDGYHECGCKDAGFKMVGEEAHRKCEDIDECSLGPKVCAGAATCLNTEGSYECLCDNGKPVDKDGNCECKCGNHGRCKEKGSSVCTCDNGYAYSEEDQECTDVDECEGKPNPCSGPGQKCENENGKYRCECSKGYKKIGDKCLTAKEVCKQKKCSEHEFCREGECKCKKGYKRSKKGKCVRVLALTAASAQSSSLSIYLGALIIGYLGHLAFTA